MALCYSAKDGKMISANILRRLQANIQIYDEKCGRDFFVAFSVGKNHNINLYEITFNHFNFWHLLGCEAKSENTLRTYQNCKNYIDISNEVNLLYDLSTFNEKDAAFVNVFDFTKNAKSIKLGYANIGPEQFQLTMAVGNNTGIIGYDYPKTGNKRFLIPKSCQNKSLSDVSNRISKIVVILSKKQEETIYNTVEYEIKIGLAKELFGSILAE